ncbi:MAG: HD domain-containing protein [Gemmatimonadota bacterium]
MTTDARPRTVRDPLWHNIRLGPEAAAVVDAPEFQRLRRVKQLGFAHLVYPGAVHTRFLHALGVHHLCRRALDALGSEGELDRLGPDARELLPLLPLAALLHDVGHYAFSHAMEEVEPDSLPGHHEEVADRFLEAEGIRGALESVHPDGPGLVGDLIRGRSEHPLQGLIAGSLDLDKIDYLARDSFFCGVPYGAVDVDRLLDALTLAREGGGPPELAVTEKGITALESLLFSKYQMFRNVYWHHTVRAATSAFRRLVESAVRAGLLDRDELPGRTDQELMNLLDHRTAGTEGDGGPAGRGGRGPGDDASRAMRRVRLLHGALVHRRLPKRSVEIFGDEIPDGMGDWMQTRPDLVRRLEDRLAREWGAAPGAVLVDYPAYPRMLELDLLLERRDGEVQRLTSAGEEGLIDLPRLSHRLHHSARVFRVYTLPAQGRKEAGPVLELLGAAAGEVEERLEEGRPLY